MVVDSEGLMMSSDKSNAREANIRWLNAIEKVGNKLPHPIALFAIFAAGIVVLSAVLEVLGVSATGELISDGNLQETTVYVQSMLTREGAVYMLTNAIKNFTNYAPLGMTLVAMLGVGVAEQSGLIHTLLKSAVKVTPAKLITPMVVWICNIDSARCNDL